MLQVSDTCRGGKMRSEMPKWLSTLPGSPAAKEAWVPCSLCKIQNYPLEMLQL